MSYLDVPRFHFAGEFLSDPGTINNVAGSCCESSTTRPPTECNWNAATAIIGPDQLLWNPDGTNHFSFRGCTVRRALDARGTVLDDRSKDQLIDGTVALDGDARLVDIDPSWQSASQIWGFTLKVTDRTGTSFSAPMKPATLRELWSTRRPGGFAAGFGGVYQSVLAPVSWNPAAGRLGSAALESLRTASPNRLSIKFVLYAYQASSGPGFTVGRVVGTVGPAAAGEPDHIPDARVLINWVQDPTRAPFGRAPFKIDSGRGKLVVDLGNAIPELASGARRALGQLTAQIYRTPPQSAVMLGALDYDEPHYVQTAGIEELDVDAAHITLLDNLALRVRGGPAPRRLVMTERPDGIHIDATAIVFRLNPGEDARVDLIATRFGKPEPGVDIGLEFVKGAPATGLSVLTGAAAPLTPVTLPGIVQTGPGGRVTVTLRAGNPGHPRAHMDGQLYVVRFFRGARVTANRQGELLVRVFEPRAVPAAPRWPDVEQILTQYSRLYPSMRRIVDLASDSAIRGFGPGALAAAMRRPDTAANFMPVTRDLSRDKTALVLKWLDAGAPT